MIDRSPWSPTTLAWEETVRFVRGRHLYGAWDMAPLLETTAALALDHLDHLDRWEALFREGIEYCLHNYPPKGETPLSWVDCCHGDGFIREKALTGLSGPAPNRLFLALALRRLNDWVPQVREAARQHLPRLLAGNRTEDTVAVLCILLSRWTTWARGEASSRNTLLTIAAGEGVAAGLKQYIIATPAGPVATLLTQLGHSPAFDLHLPDISRRARQPGVRALAFRWLLDAQVSWKLGRPGAKAHLRRSGGHGAPDRESRPLQVCPPLTATLEAAAHDPSTRVRRLAGDVLIRELATLKRTSPHQAATLIQHLATDPNPTVAERGNYAQGKFSRL